jgi:site-specific DNA-cytosine methylase
LYRAVDCQGYAGAFATAVRNAGFDIVGKVEQRDKFGMRAWMSNADWLAPRLEGWYSGDVDEWPVFNDVTLVFGNPPCSAFSSLTVDPKFEAAGMAGVNARQNQCMWDLVEYGARLDAPIVAFESVRQAGIRGLPLMKALHQRLQDLSGKRYELTLVFLNALSVGGKQQRPRMFWIASRLGPVSVGQPADSYPSLAAAIQHLADLAVDEPDTSDSYTHNARYDRLRQMLEYTHWEQGEYSSTVYSRAVAAGMPSWTVGRTDMIKSQFQARRWRFDEPARVLTGYAMDEIMHPTKPRSFTYRETAVLSGLPDEYDLTAIATGGAAARMLFGKATPVESASYIANALAVHLEGDESAIRPELHIDGVWRVDVTNAWRTATMRHELEGQLALELA